jgi:hypothetical protein
MALAPAQSHFRSRWRTAPSVADRILQIPKAIAGAILGGLALIVQWALQAAAILAIPLVPFLMLLAAFPLIALVGLLVLFLGGFFSGFQV